MTKRINVDRYMTKKFFDISLLFQLHYGNPTNIIHKVYSLFQKVRDKKGKALYDNLLAEIYKENRIDYFVIR